MAVPSTIWGTRGNFGSWTAVTNPGFGFNTAGTATVTFGGVAATGVTVVSATSITCTTAANVAGAVDVVVTNNGQSVTLVNGYAYLPTIANLGTPTPTTTGSVSGGTSVTINGTGFVSGSTTVTFGGVSATLGTVTGTSIICSTPAHGAGSARLGGAVKGESGGKGSHNT